MFYGIIIQIIDLSSTDIDNVPGIEEEAEYCVQYEDDELEDNTLKEIKSIVVVKDQFEKELLKGTFVVPQSMYKASESSTGTTDAIVLEGIDIPSKIENLKKLVTLLKPNISKPTTSSSVTIEDEDERLAVKRRKYPNGTLVRKVCSGRFPFCILRS